MDDPAVDVIVRSSEYSVVLCGFMVDLIVTSFDVVGSSKSLGVACKVVCSVEGIVGVVRVLVVLVLRLSLSTELCRKVVVVNSSLGCIVVVSDV